MDTAILRKAGLTESQAKGYLALIEHGALSPADLADRIGETRTNGYAIADKLVALGLATKKDDTSKTAYAAENPTKIRALLLARQRELKSLNTELEGIIPALVSRFRLANDKPGVTHLEGTDSLTLLYDDVLRTGTTLRIFPSAYDREDQAISNMIDQQIARQRAAGIKTEALVRSYEYESFARHNDALFEVRRGTFADLAAQILIYGDNVALTTFRHGVVTTIITSPEISQTFQSLFESQWNSVPTTA